MISTESNINFSSILPQEPKIAALSESPVLIEGPQDPENGYLAMDYPCFFSGMVSSNLYFSKLQYLYYCMATRTGDSSPERILELTKNYSAGLTSSQEMACWTAAESVTESMKCMINLQDPKYAKYYETTFIQIMGRACFYFFSQHAEFRDRLFATKNRPLVYLSMDQYWGIGSFDPGKIAGQNVWGLILTEVRYYMIEQKFETIPWIIAMIEQSNAQRKPVASIEAVEEQKPESFPLPPKEEVVEKEKEEITIEEKVHEQIEEQVAVIEEIAESIVTKTENEVVQEPEQTEKVEPVTEVEEVKEIPPAINTAATFIPTNAPFQFGEQ